MKVRKKTKINKKQREQNHLPAALNSISASFKMIAIAKNLILRNTCSEKSLNKRGEKQKWKKIGMNEGKKEDKNK